MSEPPENRPLFRSRRRDEHVRTVSRATRAVAALAILGTATFGGLAAASTKASSSTTAGAAIAPAASASTGSSSASQSSGQSATLAAPAATPVPSAQPPVASSGGS